MLKYTSWRKKAADGKEGGGGLGKVATTTMMATSSVAHTDTH